MRHLQILAAIALGVVEALHEHHEDQAQEDEPRNPPHELVRSDGHGSDQVADLVQHHVACKRDDGRRVRLGLERERRNDELWQEGEEARKDMGRACESVPTTMLIFALCVPPLRALQGNSLGASTTIPPAQRGCPGMPRSLSPWDTPAAQHATSLPAVPLVLPSLSLSAPACQLNMQPIR